MAKKTIVQFPFVHFVSPCFTLLTPAVEHIDLHWLTSYGLKHISSLNYPLNEIVQTNYSCHKGIRKSGGNV